MRAFPISAMLCLLAAIFLLTGCSAIPDIRHQPQFHNPFPQLHRVAVLPFYNQSSEPTVDQDAVALAYYNELQGIPGFEVMPVGVAKQFLLGSGFEPQAPEDFQRLAQQLGVDAVIVGSVTEYSAYYPPRIGLSVRWYAANPSFHPIPAGYGLPWGTSEEEFIPEELVFEAEFALAKEQLATQTPVASAEAPGGDEAAPLPDGQAPLMLSEHGPSADSPAPTLSAELLESGLPIEMVLGPDGSDPTVALPPDWPDPRGFVPPPPSPQRPLSLPQSEPIMSLTRLYHGNDADFTRRLENYYYFRDEARFGGWQAYLQRSDDFIRFCCHLHITELLAARGGAGKTRVVWRWPIGRYDR